MKKTSSRYSFMLTNKYTKAIKYLTHFLQVEIEALVSWRQRRFLAGCLSVPPDTALSREYCSAHMKKNDGDSKTT
jgi:hypothetical protein